MTKPFRKVDSILLKIDAYCNFYRTHRSFADFPAGWGEGAREAAKEKRISFLKAISKELDIRIRELLSDSEQNLLLQEMIECGVDSEDLPDTNPLKRIRKIIRAGTIKNEEERELVRWFLGQGPVAMLEHSEAVSLGSIADACEVANTLQRRNEK